MDTKRSQEDNASVKGDGTPYYEEALKREQGMTQEEKEAEENWWSEVSSRFRVRKKAE